MKKLTFLSIATLAALGFAFSVSAAAPATAPGQNKLLCFDGTTDGGYGGTCTTKNGAKGPATLALTSTNPSGDYAGIYTLESKTYGTELTNLTQLSYSYTATTPPQPGDLSYNLPIDTDGNGTTDAYAFIDAYYCPGVGGTVDILHDVSCGIYYNGSIFYPNWTAFTDAYPGAKVATDNSVFIVAERTPGEPAATYTITNVKFGKAGK